MPIHAKFEPATLIAFPSFTFVQDLYLRTYAFLLSTKSTYGVAISKGEGYFHLYQLLFVTLASVDDQASVSEKYY